MATIVGVDIPLPELNLTGFFASSWIYIFIIGLVGFIIVGALLIFLFKRTYNRKVVIFENIGGRGYQVALKTSARLVKLGIGGIEVMRTLAGGYYVSAYGRKMGVNTYWYVRGVDGYLYNIILGDVDTKLALLDIEPVERDVRMFYTAIDKMANQTYGKQGFLEKYGIHIMLFAFLIVMLIGMWVIAGKINEGLLANNDAVKINANTAEINQQILNNQYRILNENPVSGLVPADLTGT